MSNGSAPLSAPEALARIRNAVQQGDLAGARQIAQSARQAHPDDAAIADRAGDLALKTGDVDTALAHFADACRLAPTMLDYALNHCIALQRVERHGDVLAVLEPHEAKGRKVARYGSVRAMSHRALGELGEAAHWYDAVLGVEPGHQRALHGRARVAIERGEADAVARFDAALVVNPGEADLWLGKAQALEVAGDVKGAHVIAQQLCDQAPGFIAALSFYSGLKLAAGEKDFTAPFAAAAAKAPQDPNIAAMHAETFAGLDYAQQAASVAGEARKRFPDEPHFALLEAIHAGSAGQWDHAEAIWADLALDTPVRALHEARHRIRSGEVTKANALLDTAIASNEWDISAWALRGILWRLAGDERAQWLHEQAGLVQLRPLVGREGLVEDAVAELRVLHAGSAMPLGQSLRGGTQTRGILFHRTEAILAELHEAIRATLEEYRADLAPHDASHPLLRHRQTPWKLAGSWSVRLAGGGSGEGDYHTSHIHPQGIVSSALYLVVPEAAHSGEQLGWLEVGRPPPDLGLDLAPLRAIEPQEAHLALFPSTLYHGTTRFGGAGPASDPESGGASGGASAERMTVAFDVVTSTR